MQERWSVMNAEGEWARDAQGKVLTFFQKDSAREHCQLLVSGDPDGGWTLEPFTVDDALEEVTRSPFSGEGGL